VERVASFSWKTPAPTSVDEQLVLYDDGSARLVVRGPRTESPTIGTYTHSPDKADFAELAKAGADDVTFDLHTAIPANLADLQVLASRVADEAREKPEATALFYVRALGAPADGTVSLAVGVVGGGTRTVEFDLNEGKCTVHFMSGDQTAAWYEFPRLETGFVTPDAEGLGGLRRRAEVKPGVYGVVVVKVPVPAEFDAVYAQVGGSLYEALPDEPTGSAYAVRTDRTEVSPA
jgi:hypothetical protein